MFFVAAALIAFAIFICAAIYPRLSAMYPQDEMGNNVLWFLIMVAIVWFFSIALTCCLIYAIGAMSNNLAEINTKLEDVQFAAKELPKHLYRVSPDRPASPHAQTNCPQ